MIRPGLIRNTKGKKNRSGEGFTFRGWGENSVKTDQGIVISWPTNDPGEGRGHIGRPEAMKNT